MKKYVTFILLFAMVVIIAISGCTEIIDSTPTNESQKIPTISPTNPTPTIAVLTTTLNPVDSPEKIYTASTISPEMTPIPISESSLNARIRDAKNKLEMLKESDKVDTIVFNNPRETGCSYKMSKEIGYVLDSNTGDAFFIKGDYKQIWISTFEEKMIKNHTYILLYTHPGDWEECIVVKRNSPVYNINTYYKTFQGYYNTFSISELTIPYELTEQGYHIQEMIIVSDTNYELYPKTIDGWKPQNEVYGAIDKIEQRMDVSFHSRNFTTNEMIYFVDSLMPPLTKELGYVYIVKGIVISY